MTEADAGKEGNMKAYKGKISKNGSGKASFLYGTVHSSFNDEGNFTIELVEPNKDGSVNVIGIVIPRSKFLEIQATFNEKKPEWHKSLAEAGDE
ncbi:MAG: hypothetical protein ACYCUZ_05365 [Cuniculiplasma sp.]